MTALDDSMPTRTCTKCKECKPVESFYRKSTARGGGPTAVCKVCCLAVMSAAYFADKKKFQDRNRAAHAKNREAMNARSREWHLLNKDVANARSRARYMANKQSYIDANNRNITARRKADPLFCMMLRVKGLIYESMCAGGYTKKSRSHEILGCDWEFFKLHIERQFLKGMTWENRSEWHIDHIVPLATAKTEEDVIRLNHFTNLRPIWAKDNLSKGAQVTHLI